MSDSTATAGSAGQDRVTDTAAQVVQVDDEFFVRLLRSLRRAGHCSGIPLSRGRRKRYGDIIRALEKRIVRERYS